MIPNTINEYPAFTLAIGDAHAHFYALSFAALWLSLAWSLFNFRGLEAGAKSGVFQRRSILIIGGLVLGAWLMTNTWDAPVFGGLFGLAIWQTRARAQTRTRALLAVAAPFAIAVGTAALYFWKFKSPVSGAAFDPWAPDALSFALLWGGWIVIGALAFLLPAAKSRADKIGGDETRSDKAHAGKTGADEMRTNKVSASKASVNKTRATKSSANKAQANKAPAAKAHADSSHGGAVDFGARFRRLLIGAGLVALVAPFLFYIRGAFGDGDLRHQDTVFKFGLQAWLLLGVGLSAELGVRLRELARAPKFAVACVLVVLAPILALAPASTIWTRAITQGTASAAGRSLNGMRYLPLADQRAIEWLQRNGRAGEVVMEGVPIVNGSLGGDYDANWGRVGAFSGLSSTLGWPQHVWGWDGNYGEVMARGARIAALYALPDALQTASGASELGARYTFFGRGEGNWQTPDTDQARAAGYAVHEFAGADGSRALILERIGR